LTRRHGAVSLHAPRSARHTPGGYFYHALNRATARLKLFRKPADYGAFLDPARAAASHMPIFWFESVIPWFPKPQRLEKADMNSA